MRFAVLIVAAAACARGGSAGGSVVTLRPACAAAERWDGDRCVARTAPSALAEGEAALAAARVEEAEAAFDRASREPLDHASHVRLWQQRGLAAAYLLDAEPTDEHRAATMAAFDRLLAIDPAHRLDCRLATKATFPFEQARIAAQARGAPELQVTWRRDLRLGEPVPIDVETVADPTGVLHRATIYVRPRGETAWRATDVALAPPGQYTSVRLPAVDATDSTGLELYATASDRDGNETFLWASAARPRDVPLRFDPPTPWYRTWWVWAIAGGVVAVGAGVTTYALVWEPSGEVGGGIDR